MAVDVVIGAASGMGETVARRPGKHHDLRVADRGVVAALTPRSETA